MKSIVVGFDYRAKTTINYADSLKDIIILYEEVRTIVSQLSQVNIRQLRLGVGRIQILIFGPVFINENRTSEIYQSLLRNMFIPHLIGFLKSSKIHHTDEVLEILNQHFHP
ncbi:hypothetical protein RF11_09961 [Thelohanellus kitauei]|uniref:Uncharacterized protein n=1 Tax=Thelohanellus kitauei TaxID=669202 RepID=A0A0C2IUE5_THEKT|nr:hypothetical protein RF11_09961 [Thelohanellus kitauei]